MATWAGPPRWWARGRERAIQAIVIHCTQGSEGPTSAEAGVAYDKVRPDSVSCHCFVDSRGAALEEVREYDTAFHGRHKGNAMGWGMELCGLAQQTPAQWADAASQATLRTAAIECAARVKAWGWRRSDIRRLSVAEVRACYYAAPASRPRGFCGHIDLTDAFPEDGGTHWDPGPNFPWDQFLAMVRAEFDGTGDMALNDKQIDKQFEYILNMGKTQAAFAAGEDSVQLVTVVGGVEGKGPIRDLRPYWARLARGEGGGGLTEDQVREIAEQEADEAISGATVTTTIVPGEEA